MTIRVMISNEEQSSSRRTLRATVIEASVLNGKLEERREIIEINPGEKREFIVYAARSVLLDTYIRP